VLDRHALSRVEARVVDVEKYYPNDAKRRGHCAVVVLDLMNMV